MAGTYDEFRIRHRADHTLPFNRWCAAIGNPLIIVGQALVVAGRRRSGAVFAATGAAVLAAGHLAEGTLANAGRDLVRHPVWAIRADVALGRDAVASIRWTTRWWR